MENLNENIKMLEEAIIKTIVFFDLFDYPLTAYELWQSVGVKCELSAVIAILSRRTGFETLWEEQHGFYFLRGRQEIVAVRKRRYNYTDKKFKRVLRLTRLFKFIPWIKMIALGNLIGAHNLRRESDIDLFIVTAENRIWLSRLLAVFFIKVLGLRPGPGKTRDKICLSFFVSAAGLNLRPLMLDGGSQSESGFLSGERRPLDNGADIYFIHWLAGLTPIYDPGNIYCDLIKANGWLFRFLPNWLSGAMSRRRGAGNSFSPFFREAADLFFGGLEKNVKAIQLKKMPVDLKNLMNRDTQVVVNDQVLKLHVKDRRAEYRAKHESRCHRLGIAN